MFEKKARILTGSPSIFLDCLRIVAALTVLYIHAFNQWFPTRAHNENTPGEPSHAAVIVFFVLSGYVIAHTTISKHRSAVQYMHARLTRLCAVVIPALLITALIQLIIKNVNLQLLLTHSRGFDGIRYLMSGLFVNEIWFFSSAPPLNISLWSLSFEFWYYVIFGLCLYRAKGWKSGLMVLAACLIAGPKILLMMPIWIAGYIAYSLPRPVIRKNMAWIIVLLFLLVGWLAITFVPAIPYKIGYKPLYYANQFFTDWLIGLFVAGALWVLPEGLKSGADFKWSGTFRVIADLTFPLYVLHFPLLILWQCLFGHKLNDTTQLWEAIIAVLFISGLLGFLMEKQRLVWSQFFNWIFNRLTYLKTRKAVSKTLID